MTLRVGDPVFYYDADAVALPGVIVANPAGSTYIVQAVVSSGVASRQRKAREASFTRVGSDASGLGLVITGPVSEAAAPAVPVAFDVVACGAVLVAAVAVDTSGQGTILRRYGVKSTGFTRNGAGDVTVTLDGGVVNTDCFTLWTPRLATAVSATITFPTSGTVRVAVLDAAGVAVESIFDILIYRAPYVV